MPSHVSAPLPSVSVARHIDRDRTNSLPARFHTQDVRYDSAVSGFLHSSAYMRWFSGRKQPYMRLKDMDGATDEEGNALLGEEGENLESLSTVPETGINLCKCVVGAGSFVLPNAFKMSGWAAGIIGIWLMALVSGFTVTSLVKCKHTINKPMMSYSELGRHAFGSPMYYVISFATVLSATGACAVYLVFCGSLLGPIFHVSQNELVWILLPFMSAMALLRSFRYLAFTSIIGDLSVVAALVFVFVDALSHMEEITNPIDLPQFEPTTFARFIGSAAFLFCIHYVALPLEQSMRESTKFKPTLLKAFVICSILNSAFGACGYMFYGANVKAIVIDNVHEGIATTVVKVMLCVDLLFTYPIVLSAPREVIESGVLGWINKNKPVRPPPKGIKEFLTSVEEWQRNIIRILLVVATALIGVGVPHVDDLVTLNGGITLTLLGFILPPLIYMKVHRETLTLTEKIVHPIVVVLGIAVMVVATYQQLEDMLAPKPE